jgi:microcin C transport system substrate-binding protein
MNKNFLNCFVILFLALTVCIPSFASAAPKTSLSLYGDIKYSSDFTHFDYVNPDAPKGGVLRLPAIGSFDTLHPYIIKGQSADGVDALTGITLMTQSYDEPFSMYAYLASSVERADDNLSITFNLNSNAVWNDKTPITAHDVMWTFNTLIKEGAPFYRAYYNDVKAVTAINDKIVKFDFKTNQNKELPLIIAQMPILPKHYWADKKFTETTLTPPVSGGPYQISNVIAGRTLEFTRNKDWWGDALPVNLGRYNFDKISYSYYRDQNVALESFFAGDFDVQQENVAKLWQSAYNAPPVMDGRIIKQEIENTRPVGLQGFAYNIRRPVFQDSEVRRALAYAFDYEWENKQFAFGVYKRTRSFFENSELAATGLPDAKELELLTPLKDMIPPQVFTEAYNPPITDGSGNNRSNLKTASDILEAAGYKLGKDGIRIHEKTGVRLSFEFIDANPAFERWVLPFTQNLKRIGVECKFRVLDSTQYINRMQNFDFDMTTTVFGQSDSPGNEQREYWTSAKADIAGSRNYIGVKNPAVDSLVDKLIAAQTRDELVTATRALDRVLQWNYYVIPNWHYNKWRIAWWSHIQHPENLSGMTPAIVDTWWAKESQ